MTAASGCIIDTDDDSSTSEGSSSTYSETETDGDASSTGDAGGEDSGTGAPLDCSMCNADVDPDPLCHSAFNPETGQCECDPGYVFEGEGFECVRSDEAGDCGDDPNVMVDQNGDCQCATGYAWCSTDPDELTCCEV